MAKVDSGSNGPPKSFVPPEVILNGISHDVRRTLSGIAVRFDDLKKSFASRNDPAPQNADEIFVTKDVIVKLSSTLTKIVDDADEQLFSSFEDFLDRINREVAEPLRFEARRLRDLIRESNSHRDQWRIGLIANSISRTRRSLLALSQFAVVNREIEIDYEAINIHTEVNDRIKVDLVDPLRRAKRTWDNVTVDGEATIETSQFALASIVGNLITNSIVHGRRRKIHVEVEIKKNNLSALKAQFPKQFKEVVGPQSWASIKICDNGYGIPEKHLDRVFGLYSQAPSKRANTTGDGVGLSLVVYALEQLGGAISMQSTLNVGTCFVVYLPDGTILGDSPETIIGVAKL